MSITPFDPCRTYELDKGILFHDMQGKADGTNTLSVGTATSPRADTCPAIAITARRSSRPLNAISADRPERSPSDCPLYGGTKTGHQPGRPGRVAR
jgi:hypothetical protein